MKLKDKINNGETRTLEFKLDIPKGNQLARTVIAFANGAGGEILIGIDDNGNVAGLTDNQLNDYPDKISAIISDICFPLIVPDIYRTTIDNKPIIIIKIFPGSSKPYYMKKSGMDKGTYVRIGSVNKVADTNSLRELERQRNNISFDEEINYRYELKSFNFNKFAEDFERYAGRKLLKKDMFNLKLFSKENDREYLTNAAVILNGIEENSTVKCARFRGNEMGEFLDRKEFSGMLYDVVESVIVFIKNHILLSGKVEDIRRDDSYEVPIPALREAVINAVVHRDYSIESDIKVAVYDDMIEIISPGILPGSITIDQIDEGRSEVRNKVISRIFKEFNLIEQWGMGINKIIKSCEGHGLKRPCFKEKGGFFSVEIYRNRPKATETGRKPAENRPKATETGRKPAEKINYSNQEPLIIKYLHKNGKIDRSGVMNLLGIKDSRAKEILLQLNQKNIIERKGSGKKSIYILKDNKNFE